MKKCGPLRNLWNFKFEQQFKIYSHINTSRKNIPKSFKSNFLRNSEINQDYHFKKLCTDLKIKQQIREKFKNSDISIFSEAVIWDYLYDNRCFIGRLLNDVDIFAVICICKTKSDKILICGHRVTTVYDSHFAAYEIKSVSNTFEIIELKRVVVPPVEKVYTSLGKTFRII